MGRQAVPVHATVAAEFTADLPDGAVIRVRRYEGRASDGYKTDFERRPAQWVEIRRTKVKPGRYVKRFTGRRLGQAANDYAAAVREVENHLARLARR